MPAILRIGRYVVCFWSNENNPREFIHVHVSVKHQAPNSTKLFITSNGDVVVYNIPEIEDAWFDRFGEIHYIR